MSNMELDTVFCDDGHRCDNGSKCVEDKQDEGAFYCDCDVAGDDATAFAGLYCEHVATEYCSSKHLKASLCTNGGTCNMKVHKENKHFGCKCPDGYLGDFCQFTGNVPENWPTLKASALDAQLPSSGVSTGGAWGISIAVIAVAFILGFVVFRSYTTRKSSDVPIETPDPASTMAGSDNAGASLPHPDEVRQSVAEGTAGTGSPRRTRAEPNAVMDAEDIDEANLEDVVVDNDII
jgi:hypothetical protein